MLNPKKERVIMGKCGNENIRTLDPGPVTTIYDQIIQVN